MEVKQIYSLIFQSTLPLRGATGKNENLYFDADISIHAPPAGSDIPYLFQQVPKTISIHAPPAGSDFVRISTIQHSGNFNPRSPCGERLTALRSLSNSAKFQSTLPLRGATKMRPSPCWMRGFQSTLPLRGATGGREKGGRKGQISIHAPPAGSDQFPAILPGCQINFNPRSPCGERHPDMWAVRC